MTRRTILLPLLLTALFLLAGASAAHAQGGDHRAGLVIRYADGSVQTQCVAFSEPSITGEELLQRSGLAVTLDYNAGLGGAVCSINNQGCAYPIKDCFCKCTGIQCEYWAYYHRTAAGWQYASSGASSFPVNDGALEGWSWGAGNFSSGVEPPARGVQRSLCATGDRHTHGNGNRYAHGDSNGHANGHREAATGSNPTPGRLRGEHDGGLARRLHAVALVGNRCDRIDPEWCACQRTRSEAGLPAGYATFHPDGCQYGRSDGARAHGDDRCKPDRPGLGSAGIYGDPHPDCQRREHPFGHAGSRCGAGPDNRSDSAGCDRRSCPDIARATAGSHP